MEKKILKLVLTNSGFSIIEILVSASIFSLISVSMIGAYIFLNDVGVYSGEKTRALFLAEEGIEAVRNIKDEHFSNLDDGTWGLYEHGGQWNLQDTSDMFGIYTRTIQISSIDDDTKKVESLVTWENKRSNLSSVYLETSFSDWSRISEEQFYESDYLFVDISGSSLSNGNRRVVGITLENISDLNITIDKIKISWIGGSGPSRLNVIRINGQDAWGSGSAQSGEALDISDFILQPYSNYPLDYLQFSHPMRNSVVDIVFIMSDGSEKDIFGISL